MHQVSKAEYSAHTSLVRAFLYRTRVGKIANSFAHARAGAGSAKELSAVWFLCWLVTGEHPHFIIAVLWLAVDAFLWAIRGVYQQKREIESGNAYNVVEVYNIASDQPFPTKAANVDYV